MIRLLRIELRRMWRRRMPWVLLLGVSSAILAGGVITFVTNESEMPAARDIEAEVEKQVADCRAYTTDEWNAWNQGEMQNVDPGYEEYLTQFESAEAMADDQWATTSKIRGSASCLSTSRTSHFAKAVQTSKQRTSTRTKPEHS